MRCAIYARVSSDEQREKKTITPQLEILPAYRERHGWSLVDTYIDDGCSGESIVGRPAFQRLIADVTTGKIDVILAIDHDRFTRSKDEKERGEIHDLFRDHHVHVATPGMLLDLNKPDHSFMFCIKSSVATLENSTRRDRFARGKESKARAGFHVNGRVVYGYTRTKKSDTQAGGLVEIHPIHGAVVHRVVQMFLFDDLSLNRIATRLNQEGLRSPLGTRWSSAALSRILRNPAHKGTMVVRTVMSKKYTARSVRDPDKIVKRHKNTPRPESEWCPIQVPPLMTPQEWDRVQQRLATARSNNFNNVKRDRTTDPYLLRGLARCGLCGAKLQTREGTAQGSRYYYCLWSMPSHAQRRGSHPCALPGIPAAAAERTPLAILTHSLLMPEALIRQYGEMVSGTPYLEQLRQRLAHLTREAKTVRDQQDRLLDKTLARLFPADLMEAKATELHSKMAWLTEQRTTLEREVVEIETRDQTLTAMRAQSHGLFTHRRTLQRWWKTATPGQRQQLMHALIDPEDGGKVLVYPPPPGYTPDGNLDSDGWGGRVECRFTFDPNRLVKCLEYMGVVHQGSAKGTPGHGG